jgi:two-component system repressor protein LuxO
METLSSPAVLLLVEPDPVQAESLLSALRKAGHAVVHAATGQLALKAAATDRFSVVLLDSDLADKPGMEVLASLRQGQSAPEVIVLTARGSVGSAVEAMKAGAYDFLMKPVPPEKVLVSVRNALERHQLSGTVACYRKSNRTGFQTFIGSSPAMQAVYRMVESAAASKATVFVTGESGTGKEVCAQSIHHLSPRAGEPFVALNCAAIPKDLIESEVFGHVKGAFTGATADRDGAARQADGGTLFLDEICEMDLNLQGKLLRFLQTGTFQRVGGSKTEQVDVRILCATNRDPLAEVEAGRFREDLYYRLHVIPLGLPPLRDRERDVLEIATHLLTVFAKEEGKSFRSFSPEVGQMLLNYDWPGNVRQLQNIIRNIVVLNDGEQVVPEMVPPPVGGRWARPHGFRRETPVASVSPAPSAQLSSIRPLAEVEREAVETAITLCNGNVPKAAALLGVSPSTLYRKKQAWDGSDGTAA